MSRHLALLFVVFLCVSFIHALPVNVEPAQPKNVDIQKSADSANDLEPAASSWGGYGIRGWFGPSYSYGGQGHYGNGWGNNHNGGGGNSGWGNNHNGGGWNSGWGNNHHGGGWNSGWGNGWGWGNQGYGNGWGNQGYGGGWRRNHGYGSGWNGNWGGYW